MGLLDRCIFFTKRFTPYSLDTHTSVTTPRRLSKCFYLYLLIPLSFDLSILFAFVASLYYDMALFRPFSFWVTVSLGLIC